MGPCGLFQIQVSSGAGSFRDGPSEKLVAEAGADERRQPY